MRKNFKFAITYSTRAIAFAGTATVFSEHGDQKQAEEIVRSAISAAQGGFLNLELIDDAAATQPESSP